MSFDRLFDCIHTTATQMRFRHQESPTLATGKQIPLGPSECHPPLLEIKASTAPARGSAITAQAVLPLIFIILRLDLSCLGVNLAPFLYVCQ